MVVVVNTYKVVLDKMEVAMDLLRRVGALPYKKELGVQYSVMRRLDGDMFQLLQVNRFPSLTVRDEYLKTRDSDPKNAAIMKEMRESGCFLAAERHFYEEVW